MRKLFSPVLAFVLLNVLIYLISCRHDPETPLTLVCFDSDVQPVLNSYCAKSGCHDATTHEAGIVLSSYEEIIKHVSKGDPQKSDIYKTISARSGSENHMPPDGHNQLSYKNVRDIYVWILQQAEHTTCNGSGECDTNNITYKSDVYPIFEIYCIGCHGGNTPSAGISLTDFSQVAATAQNGQLLGSIKHNQGFTPMPPGGSKLSDCNISKVKIWIRDTTFTEQPPTGPCDPDSVYFEKDLLSVLVSNCAKSGCHDVASHAEGVILTSYAQTISTAGVRPYQPYNSKLYEVITSLEPDDLMPPSPASPLSSGQISMINKWISQGAKNLSCIPDCDSVNVTFSSIVLPIVQSNCTGCHSGTSPSGGIALTNYSGIQTIGSNGSLLGTITWSSGYSAMPKNSSKLSECKIGQIRKWITNGMPQNRSK
jgi:mono/diheme cytochrome c family protein